MNELITKTLRVITMVFGIAVLVVDLISPFEVLNFIKIMVIVLWSLEVLGE